MPTYAYACKQCDHRFETVQSFSDPTLTVCPECGGPLRKEYGSIGVTFNGSGFYRTDSRSGGAKSTAAAGSSDSSSGGGATTTSTSLTSESKSSTTPAAS
ncbi:MAG: FmdB family transcriptional regulator [Microbacterium sp.]|uniref:FmdB family zinc ribbon protein n=1 Tax=Microbacterium sp. TaxID=51671 RepID=UPI0026383297|nr:FmdB family zinc ribbon protein [Microbacterium sp.]MCX6501632.1 FmdB family transcriptional regulator [Microbacterium sp.]